MLGADSRRLPESGSRGCGSICVALAEGPAQGASISVSIPNLNWVLI